MNEQDLHNLLILQSPYYEDFAPYRYEGSETISRISRVGWIRADESFTSGRVPPSLIKKLYLAKLSTLPVNFHFHKTRSGIPCTLCEPGNRASFSSELLIPRVDLPGSFFGSQSMIDHLITDHGYKPPDEFIDSVMSLDLSKPFDAVITFDEISLDIDSMVELYKIRANLFSGKVPNAEEQRYKNWLDLHLKNNS
ncbi:hypothetical protein [Tahibacter caeni]|uniref:DUF7919 family protein n=1 Tax=Tahibacter caeni TaxID=1453545 RepID=UPI002148F9E0|nr:hypothetical protein [Tahibacter caeni]